MALTQVTSAGIKDGEIVNADLNSSAAIALSKLATSGTAGSGNYLRGDGAWSAIDLSTKLNLTGGTLTGDLTINMANGSAVIADNSENYLFFGDNVKSVFGNSADVEIFHDGSHSYLTNSTGILHIRGQGSGIRLQKSDGEPMIYAIPDGAVEIYYDNSKKAETNSSGLLVNNRLQLSGPSIYDKSGTGNSVGIQFSSQGVLPTDGSGAEVNNSKDLGSSSYRWRNIYTNDLNLSNEGGSNDVDGSWGSYTIQEGAEDLFLVNRRNGKKYKFNLTEVS